MLHSTLEIPDISESIQHQLKSSKPVARILLSSRKLAKFCKSLGSKTTVYRWKGKQSWITPAQSFVCSVCSILEAIKKLWLIMQDLTLFFFLIIIILIHPRCVFGPISHLQGGQTCSPGFKIYCLHFKIFQPALWWADSPSDLQMIWQSCLSQTHEEIFRSYNLPW